MPRRFKVLDGTLANVGERIVGDYEDAGFYCDSNVGSYATEQLGIKLRLGKFEKLGFTADKLTLSLGKVSFSDHEALERVFDKLHRDVIIPCGLDFIDGCELDDKYEYIRKNKSKIIVADTDARDNLRRETQKLYHEHLIANGEETRYNHWLMGDCEREVTTTYINVFNYAVQDEFYKNQPHKRFAGMKPSKFLSKYVEPHMPGITDEYSVALASSKEVEVHLTIDPNIMINCTEASTFSSCFRFDGEYHYSAQRFANGQDTLMAVVFDSEGRIMYRNWVLVNNLSDKVITFRAYSDINTKLIAKEVKTLVRDTILGTSDYSSVSRGEVDIHHDDSNGYAYLDEAYVSYIGDECNGWNTDSEYFQLGKAMCVEFGEWTTEEEIGGTSYCECCDERYHEDDMRHVDDYGYVCQDCIDNHFTEVQGRWGYEYIRDEDVVRDVHDTAYHPDHHELIEHSRSGEYYPEDELICTYDTDECIEPDEAYYSDELNEYYGDLDRMREDESHDDDEGVA